MCLNVHRMANSLDISSFLVDDIQSINGVFNPESREL